MYYSLLRERTYDIEGYKVVLPAQHRLDLYQKNIETYDRFLPLLAEHVDKSKLVIDVGANIGDSAIPFLKRGIKTICVEPSDYFFKYMEKNLRSTGLDKNAVLMKNFVSNSTAQVNLTMVRGTATSLPIEAGVLSSEAMTSFITLDKIFEANPEDVSLVKIDTDGFDFDVIMSGQAALKSKQPIVFFENLVSSKNLDGYVSAYSLLEAAGYKHVVIFDNLGNIMVDHANWDNVISINEYVMRRDFVPIAYTDILCYTDKSEMVARKAVDQFKSRFSSSGRESTPHH